MLLGKLLTWISHQLDYWSELLWSPFLWHQRLCLYGFIVKDHWQGDKFLSMWSLITFIMHVVAALSVHPSVCQSHSCPAHNFVIWSQISKLFYRYDHHVETTCHVQHLGPYLEGQGHSMTLQQNCVRPITLLFEVGF